MTYQEFRRRYGASGQRAATWGIAKRLLGLCALPSTQGGRLTEEEAEQWDESPGGPDCMQCSICLNVISAPDGVALPGQAASDSTAVGPCEAGDTSSIELHVPMPQQQEPVMFTARNDIACVALQCGHSFHKACADQWLRQHHTCPNCRQRVHYEAPSTSYDSYGRDVATDPNRQHTPASNTHLNTHLNVHWTQRERTNNVRVVDLSGGGVLLDFTMSPLADDVLLKGYIHKYGALVERLDCPSACITKRSVKRVYTYCPNLTYLDVSHCGTLNWSCVTELVKHCPRLQHLQIAYCSSINDKALGAIAGSPFGETQGLLHLRTLDVTGCNQITDKGLRMLQKCHRLETLRVSFCTRLTDLGVASATASLQSLKTLKVRGCKHLTMHAVRSIINNAPYLEKLDVVACYRIQGMEAAGQMVRSMMCLNEVLTNDVILSGAQSVQGLRNRIVR